MVQQEIIDYKKLYRGENHSFHSWTQSLFLLSNLIYTLVLLKLRLLGKIFVYLNVKKIWDVSF